ncbi:carbohydrate ABC transporter membrane protein 1 (CUT1 family) [Isoptericola sp. CG 20/1183]|uniref:Carbohydrate ABC transporter membrane protein 1 (CUT1 family) n=1 Tax=Isoptericola halotolerans TaxID=300560 RepID=A0ABX5EKA0_9MICO|nr:MULTISPECIES: sugar ABC transporter permease [Isoptericola]PRZ08741.1 carbohydrate ABC transporter membrane protein 1 (CUT1 family) [Isoptericola halotolerans]PRZ10812.1 carbohydrate ABC transporter membrane protein 1 (CUT1 family) [Isoptericola sp. CG 20/1183]
MTSTPVAARPRVRTARTRGSAAQRDRAVGYLMVAPQVLGTVAFVIVPLVTVAWYSLHEWNVLAGTFVFSGADNYERMLADPGLRDSLVASLWFSVGLVVLNVTLALLLAVLLDQKLPGTTTFRTFFFSPVVVSLVAWTIVWGFLLQDDGGINGFLASVGVEGPNWLRSGPTAMLAVIVVQVFKNVGLNMILFLAALQSVPEEVQEAARIDGAGAWRRFRSITLPLISPTVLLVSILTVVGSLEVFAQIDVLTGGGPGNSTTVLVYYLYQQAFRFNEFGYASAISVLLFVIVLALTLIQWRTRKRWVHDEV